jgi:hypothetical protein
MLSWKESNLHSCPSSTFKMYAFLEGMYNGSALSILGRNPALDTVREMPIVGGSGVFRYARGYALAKTVWFSPKSGNAVVEYNVSVLHF